MLNELQHELAIRCEACGLTPTVRIAGRTLCRACAHAAIDNTTTHAAPVMMLKERTDDDTVAALADLGPGWKSPRDVIRKVGARALWVSESLKRLEAAGRVRRHPRTFGVTLAAAVL